MPQEYEEIRDSIHARGISMKEAKHEAAAIYNSRHPDHPVTGHHEGRKHKHGKKHRHKSKG